ncbi:MAG: hypothetical protein AB7W59_20110 [Acidimicrobiia bacterium]
MNTSDVLNTAADLLEERGWTQVQGWGWEKGLSNLCLEGGILIASGIDMHTTTVFRDLNTCPAATAVREYLTLEPMDPNWHSGDPRETGPLWCWNDAIGRTAEQVIATLRATALMVAARESADELTEVSA